MTGPDNGHANTYLDRTVEIERLATLDPINYEVARGPTCQRLGVRASVLDREVKKKRLALGLEKKEDDGQGRAVKIPDVFPWHEPADGDMLATTLACTVKSYVALRDEEADAIAIWILHSWLVNSFTISPRLAVTSPTKGCGKTTVLRLLNLLARRPKRAGSISPPALFRAVEQFQPTILLDETEKYIEHGGDLHALLNEGHCKGGTVLRVLGEKLELREFSVFGAVAFARNGRLPDDLEQRSIVIELQRRRPDEPLGELREDRCEPLQRLARMCARWAEDSGAGIAEADPDMGCFINRAADNWRPLFAIADTLGGEWPERLRAAAAALAPRESESIGPMLLADVQVAYDGAAADRLSSVDICEALTAMEGRPWAEWGKSKKPLTPNQLARLLKPFGITSGQTRFGEQTRKGYYLHAFEDAFARYLGPQGVTEPKHRNKCDEMDSSEPSQSETKESHVSFQKCEKPNKDGLGFDVSVERGGTGNARACDEGNGHAPVAPSERRNGRDVGLSEREIEKLAAWYENQADAFRDGSIEIEQEALDIGLRRVLAEKVLPEHVQREFMRVMERVFDA
jgi:hypothetical protein